MNMYQFIAYLIGIHVWICQLIEEQDECNSRRFILYDFVKSRQKLTPDRCPIKWLSLYFV